MLVLAVMVAKSHLRENCIFSGRKRATARSSFFDLEKNNFIKMLVANSAIGFKKY
jgi:ribosomal protein S14